MLSNIPQSFHDTYNEKRSEILTKVEFLFWHTCVLTRYSWNIETVILPRLKTFLAKTQFHKIFLKIFLQERCFQSVHFLESWWDRPQYVSDKLVYILKRKKRKTIVLFTNKSLFDINYPELLTLFYYWYKCIQKCLKYLRGVNCRYRSH